MLLRSIRRMYYHGCDSWGLCTCDDRIHARKVVGQPDESSAYKEICDLHGYMGLAHTRWGTHGGPSKENTHPIMGCLGEIAVIHNGVITNYEEIRATLLKNGHNFVTQTDTEVIPHLIGELVRNGSSLTSAMASVYRSLKGSFSFVMTSTRDGERIYACRKTHPLYIGRSSTCSIVTSEPSLIPGLVYQVAPQRTGSIATLSPGSISIVDISSGEDIKPPWVGVDRRFLADSRRGFRHYLEKEIIHEPDSLLIMALGDLINIELLADLVGRSDRLFFLCDSASYNSSLIASHLLGDIARFPSCVFLTSEFPRLKETLSEGDLVIGMTGGNGGDVLVESLRLSRIHGSRTVAITGNVSFELQGVAEQLISLGHGKRSLSSMGNYVGQVGLSMLLAHSILGNIDKGIKGLSELGNSMKKSLPEMQKKVHVLASSFYRSNTVFLFGRNTAYPVALEAADEIKNLANITSIGLENASFGSEGHLRIGPDTTCICFVRSGDTTMLNSAPDMKSEGARLIGICESDSEIFDDAILVPQSHHLFSVSGIIALQMLAYEASILLGNNPDKLAFQN